MNARTKFSAACATALMTGLLLAAPTFAQTPVPPTTVPLPTSPATTAPATTPVSPPSGTEDDRRVLRGDRTITADNFVLRTGETLRGDLTVLGGNVRLEEGSRVEGDLNVMGGNADIAGAVTKDLSVFGGSINLRSTAEVEGDIIRFGGTLNRSEGAVVGGRETGAVGPFGTRTERSVVVRDDGPLDGVFGWFVSAVATVFGIVLITLIALAFATLLPNNLVKAAAVAVSQWGMSGVVGALTLIAVPILVVILAITICLIPVALLLVLAYVIAILAGWVVSARLVGERLMAAVNRSGWALIAQVAAGAIVLALLGAIPFVGAIIAFVAVSLGLGALILSRFGTQNYPRTLAPRPLAPIAPAAPNDLIGPTTPAAVDPFTPPASPEPPSETQPDEPRA